MTEIRRGCKASSKHAGAPAAFRRSQPRRAGDLPLSRALSAAAAGTRGVPRHPCRRQPRGGAGRPDPPRRLASWAPVADELLQPQERRWTWSTGHWASSRARSALGVRADPGAVRGGLRWDDCASARRGCPGATDHITLPVSHLGMLVSARVARETGRVSAGQAGFRCDRALQLRHVQQLT